MVGRIAVGFTMDDDPVGPTRILSGEIANLSGSVGKGADNRAEDVMLLQYFLRRFGAEKDAPTSNLKVDGKYGKITQEWHVFSKDVMRLEPLRVTRDGKTSPQVGASGRFTDSNGKSSLRHIVYLNVFDQRKGNSLFRQPINTKLVHVVHPDLIASLTSASILPSGLSALS